MFCYIFGLSLLISIIKAGASPASSMPKSNAENLEQIAKEIMRCTKDHPVDMREILDLQKYIVPRNKDAKCLLACAYRKVGFLTKDGLYDVKYSLEVMESLASGDEARKKNGTLLVETCAKSNENKVSDGEKGCDIAAMIFKCLTQDGAKLGYA